MYHVQGLNLEPTKIKFSTPCNSVCKNVLPTQRLHFISVFSSLIQEINVFNFSGKGFRTCIHPKCTVNTAQELRN